MSTSTSSSATSNMSAANASKLSHTLSKILRHAAPQLGLKLDAGGYATMSDLLALPMMQKLQFANLQTIQQVVKDCPKQRFGILKPGEGSSSSSSSATASSQSSGNSLNEWRIRANQGHNKALAAHIDAATLMTLLTASTPANEIPSICVHGTNLNAWKLISQSGGLHPMARTHIHFASHDFGSAEMVSGMRRDSEVLVHLDLPAVLAWTARSPSLQLQFFVSANQVILTPGVVEYANMLPSFLFSRVEHVELKGGAIKRTPLEWKRPSEEEWNAQFAAIQREKVKAAASSSSSSSASSSTPAKRKQTQPASISAIFPSTSSDSSMSDIASSSSALQRPPPRESRWGPPATSRPPPDWKVPDRLAHIVNGTAPANSASSSSDSSSASVAPASQPFDFLAVIDFEATCQESGRIDPQEIIEFPIVLVDTKTQKVVDIFQTYVTPKHHPNLSPFCTQLTGITQGMVSKENGAVEFEVAWKQVLAFLAKHNLVPAADADSSAASSSSSAAVATPLRTFTFVTCGDWDLKTALPAQLITTFGASSRPPSYFTRWINIKTLYNNYFKPKDPVRGMPSLLASLNLTLEGRHHSGLDDSKNIAACARRMLEQGVVFRLTQQEKRRPPTANEMTQRYRPSSSASATSSSASAAGSSLMSALNRNSNGKSRIQHGQ